MKHRHGRWTAAVAVLIALLSPLSCGRKPAGFSGDLDAGDSADGEDAGGSGSCVFDCVSAAECTPDQGTKIDELRMSCPRDGDVCCALITGCEYDCVPTGSCEEGGGVVHTEQSCASADRICCETPCVHECMSSAQCEETGGTVHEEMNCETSGSVCCEPGSRYCQSPYTCVPPRECDTGNEHEGDCVVHNQVCCLVPRCNQNGGICRTSVCVPVVERSSPNYYCPGNQICCR